VALACGFILAVTRAGVLNPGRAQAVVPLGEMLQVQQLPPAVIRSPADSPAGRRRLPIQSQGYGASLTLERLFTDPRRP
jgi:hypothetical protein